MECIKIDFEEGTISRVTIGPEDTNDYDLGSAASDVEGGSVEFIRFDEGKYKRMNDSGDWAENIE